jgi:hypothetical protein
VIHETVTEDLSNYGPQPRPVPPPADQTQDLILLSSVHLIGADPVLKPPGFGNQGVDPLPGMYTALGVVTRTAGYGALYRGLTRQRWWVITRSCYAHQSCTFQLTRQISAGSQSATLIRQADGWHATFPPEIQPCAERNGYGVAWREQPVFIIHFSDGGMKAEANERISSAAPHCGSATAVWQWQATRLQP